MKELCFWLWKDVKENQCLFILEDWIVGEEWSCFTSSLWRTFGSVSKINSLTRYRKNDSFFSFGGKINVCVSTLGNLQNADGNLQHPILGTKRVKRSSLCWQNCKHTDQKMEKGFLKCSLGLIACFLLLHSRVAYSLSYEHGTIIWTCNWTLLCFRCLEFVNIIKKKLGYFFPSSTFVCSTSCSDSKSLSIKHNTRFTSSKIYWAMRHQCTKLPQITCECRNSTDSSFSTKSEASGADAL